MRHICLVKLADFKKLSKDEFDTKSRATQNALNALNRLYEVSKLKLAVDVLAARAQSPVTVAEIGSAIAPLPQAVCWKRRAGPVL